MANRRLARAAVRSAPGATGPQKAGALTNIATFLAIVGAPYFAHAADFSTPRGAVEAYLEAMTRDDVDALVAAQDFRFEARDAVGAGAGQEADAAKAAALEAAYRARMGAQRPLKRDNRKCQYVATLKNRGPRLNVVFECPIPGGDWRGGEWFPSFIVVRNDAGWHVVLNFR